jgi:hypothetical protein
MLFLDAMYILCCDFYKKREMDIFKISGLILLALVFLLNITLISFLLPKYFPAIFEDDYLYDRRYYIVFLSDAALLIMLYFRYFKLTSYDEVVSKMYSLKPGKRNGYSIAALFYILLSIGLPLTYAFYKGGIKNG